jgi:hypothetical protein
MRCWGQKAAAARAKYDRLMAQEKADDVAPRQKQGALLELAINPTTANSNSSFKRGLLGSLLTPKLNTTN